MARKLQAPARVAITGVIALAIVALAILGAPRPATAQQPASAGAMPGEPSIRETGQVAQTRVTDPVKIRDAHAVRPAGELAVDKTSPAERPAAPEAAGRIDQALLARQIRSRFAALGECPVEVARHHHLARASAAAGRFTLRWTILRSGRVADTAVVADSPVNERVMDCVKRQMNTWSFTPPEGGTVRLERPFRFRGR